MSVIYFKYWEPEQLKTPHIWLFNYSDWFIWGLAVIYSYGDVGL